jgi:hypothetical protein
MLSALQIYKLNLFIANLYSWPSSEPKVYGPYKAPKGTPIESNIGLISS